MKEEVGNVPMKWGMGGPHTCSSSHSPVVLYLLTFRAHFQTWGCGVNKKKRKREKKNMHLFIAVASLHPVKIHPVMSPDREFAMKSPSWLHSLPQLPLTL